MTREIYPDIPVNNSTAYLRPKIAVMKTGELTARFYDPEQFTPLCRECVNYGMNYACPPLPFDAAIKLSSYAFAQIIAAKIAVQGGQTRAKLALPPFSARRKITPSGMPCRYGRVFAYRCQPGAGLESRYEAAKHAMDERLLRMESERPESIAVSAGACRICRRCGRIDGEPCRYPERARVSLDAFSLDLTAIARDIFGMPLLWQSKGKREYLVIISALFTNHPLLPCRDAAQGTSASNSV